MRLLNGFWVGVILVSLAGCESSYPFYAYSIHGLIGEGGKAEPFDSRYVGEWFGPSWERVEWKIERLRGGDEYLITHIGKEEEKTHFVASLVKVGDLKLVDLARVREGQRSRPEDHLILRLTYSWEFVASFGPVRPEEGKKWEAFGNRRLIRYRRITLRPLKSRYFKDHPDLLPHEKTFDDKANEVGLRLTAPSKDLRAFLESHEKDENIWVDEGLAIKLEAK